MWCTIILILLLRRILRLKIKTPLSILIVLLFVHFPAMIFAKKNCLTMLNDTEFKRKIAVHCQKTTSMKEDITVDYQEKTIPPHCYEEFNLKEGAQIVHIIVENREEGGQGINPFTRTLITQWGEYSVSKMLQKQQESDWDYLSW